MKIVFVLFIIVFLCSQGVAPQTFSSQGCLLCKVAAYDVHYETNIDGGDATICITDAPYNNGGSGVGYFHLQLPEIFAKEHAEEILAGNFQICIEGGVASRVNYTVSYPENATISVIPQLTVRDVIASRAVGDLSLLAVRVTSRAGEDPGITAVEIEGAVFGTGSNASDPNVTSQYDLCSAGNLRFHAPSGSNINNGVLDVVVDGPFQGGDMIGALQTEIITAVEAAVGSITQFSKIMLCVPTGSSIPGGEALAGGTWSAFAHINGDVSIFQNQNCGRISATMHEIGHNIGFYHSSKGLDEYGDHTCYMGVGHLAFRWPKQCFNGHKNWLAGWYTGRQVSIDPVANGAYSGRVVAFVEWNSPQLQPNDVVLINVGDLYILFNRRISYNIESQDAYDMVTVTQGTSTRSFNLANLNTTQSFAYSGYNGTSSNLIIEVCDIVFGATLDYAVLSIYVDGTHSSTCTSTAPSPATLSPSIAATTKVSSSPTSMPQTLSPTTISPVTFPPTISPQILPTFTISPVTFPPTTISPNTFQPTTISPVTFSPTTISPDTFRPTTLPPTTVSPSKFPSTILPATSPPTTLAPITAAPTILPATSPPTTVSPSKSPLGSSTVLPPDTFAPTRAVSPPKTNPPMQTSIVTFAPSPVSPGSTLVTPPSAFLPTTSIMTMPPSTLAASNITTTATIAPAPIATPPPSTMVKNITTTTSAPTPGASVSPTTAATAKVTSPTTNGTPTSKPQATMPTSKSTNAPSSPVAPQTLRPGTSAAPSKANSATTSAANSTANSTTSSVDTRTGVTGNVPVSAPITAPPYLFQVTPLTAVTSWAVPSHSSIGTMTLYLAVAWIAGGFVLVGLI